MGIFPLFRTLLSPLWAFRFNFFGDIIATDFLGAALGDATTGAVGSGLTGFGLDAGLAGTGLATSGAAAAGGLLGAGAGTDALASLGVLGGAAGTDLSASGLSGLSALSSLWGGGLGSTAQTLGGLGQLLGGYAALSAKPNKAADPFAAYRGTYANELNALMANPNSVTQTPGYQFQLAQGLQAQQAQQAAQGSLVSGGANLQAQQYGQGLASKQYQQQLSNLEALSGANQSPATGQQAASNISNTQLGTQLGALQLLASGLGNVTGNPLGTLYSQYNKATPSAQG